MPTLTPPDTKHTTDNHEGTGPDKTWHPPALSVRIKTLVGVFILVDIAIILFFLVPDRTSGPVQEKAATEMIEKPTEQDSKSHPEKCTDATNAATKWLNLQAKAEADNITQWGKNNYMVCVKMARQASRLAAKNLCADALHYYLLATDKLHTILRSKHKRLETAIKKGQKALDRQDSTAAILAFRMALSIDPGNTVAVHGLKRAKNLDRVTDLYRQGLDMEKQGNLNLASARMKEALQTDHEFKPAAEALHRINARADDLMYQKEMSRFFAALRKKDFTAAHDAINAAARLKPKDRAVHEAILTLKNKETRAKLSLLQNRCRKLIEAEKWQDVITACEQAKKIDPDAAFFIQQKQEAKRRLAIDIKLRSIIARPERLQEKGPLEEARHALIFARSIPGTWPRLKSQIKHIDRLIANALKEIRVTFHSDNLTHVIIYRVKDLGKFTEKEIILHPGIYTAIGRRPGYRDIRLVFRITGHNQTVNIHIACEEPI